ncbi:MAG TPA: hypothetical protein PKA13_11600, partial [Geminicoccaceae bacterium]|nr:hypothetical protein [Geminicoccaceae bacterium]
MPRLSWLDRAIDLMHRLGERRTMLALATIFGVVTGFWWLGERVGIVGDDEGLVKEAQAGMAELAERAKADAATIAALNAAIEALAERKGPGIREALELLTKGDAAAAETIFQKVRDSRVAEGVAANHEAAEAARHLGALAYLSDTQKALAAYRDAAALDPGDVWTWIFIGRLERRLGRLEAAEAAFTEARRRAEEAGAERDVMAADSELGDVAMASGALTAAADRYQSALDIAEKLAAADPRNAEWQRD